jgi:hypothetical protein
MVVHRPPTLVAAITLLAYAQLRDLLTLALGGMPAGAEIIPLGVIIIGLVAGLISLAAIYGLWTMRRWGMILGLLVAAVGVLGPAPGLAFAPTRELWVSALIGVLTGLTVIILLVLPASRQALAGPKPQPA